MTEPTPRPRRCWLWHRWGGWTEPQVVFAHDPLRLGPGLNYQDRTCSRCGYVQRRQV